MRHFTLVSFHAHPDDETLLTGGTLAAASEAGHRVVVVVATLGEAGLAEDDRDLGSRRWSELQAATRALGVDRVVCLGYADSGYEDASHGPGRLVDAPAEDVARRLAAVLAEEQADVLTTYDENGGYGHPDHVQVHRAGRLAGEMVGTPVVLEATVDRLPLLMVITLLRTLSWVLPTPQLPRGRRIFTPRRELTHVIDVRPYLDAKLAALACHASQGTGGSRTLGLLLQLPRPWVARVLGREWYREVGTRRRGPLSSDVFSSLGADVLPFR